MKKYYCDICETEVAKNSLYIGNIGFDRMNIELCSSCFDKFGLAKATLFSTYSEKYSQLDEEYLEALKDEILREDVNPEPEFEGGE